MPEPLTIGELAARTGVAASALRFYEERGLIHAERTGAGHRRFARPTIRRVAFVVFDLFSLPFELVFRVYGEAGEPGDLRDVATAVLVAANVAWTALGAGVVIARYRALAVTK